MSATDWVLELDRDALFLKDNALTRQSLIDDFEHNSPTAFYRTDPTTGTWRTNTTAQRPASTGRYGLDLDGERRIWSLPGDGLQNYPQTGTAFAFHVRPRRWSPQSQIWLFFGGTAAGNHSRYQIDLILNDGTFRVIRDVNGNKTVLDSARTAGYNSSHWYQVLVVWRAGGGFDIYLRRDGVASVRGHIASNDSTYTGISKVGYRCSGNARTFVDDVAFVL